MKEHSQRMSSPCYQRNQLGRVTDVELQLLLDSLLETL